MLAPGAGSIFFKKYQLAFFTQGLLLLIVSTICLSRVVLTPAGITALILTLASVHLGSWTLCIHQSLNTQIKFDWRNFFYSAVFCVFWLAVFMVGFVYKNRFFGIQIYFIPSPSMQPTLEPGDVILVDTWAYRNQAPQLGDIIIFTSDAHQGVLVKRIQPWPEGVESEEKYYVMGDNRKESLDSRYFGGIEQKQIQGKVELILLSTAPTLKFRENRWLKSPISFP